MDIRRPVLAIIVGGTPAPGINGVITAVALEAMNNGLEVVGIKCGFRYIKQGSTSKITHKFSYNDVAGLYAQGGSFLKTSRHTLNDATEVDNCLRSLEYLRVRHLVTIGGTITAYSASLVASAAKQRQYQLSVVHVPKSIFNDLPIPNSAQTFGFDTARQVGFNICHNLKTDARTMNRWYIVVVMGQKAGHLCLGIAKSAAATLSLIPEEFRGKKLDFETICTVIEGSIVKRAVLDRHYGLAVITEGLVDLMDPEEVKSRWGDFDNGHQQLGHSIVQALRTRCAEQKMDVTLVARNLGTECRAADPNATDTALARDLGYGATRFLLAGGTGCLVTLQDGAIFPIPLMSILDAKSGRTHIRLVDTTSLTYEVAKKYETRLKRHDLLKPGLLHKMAQFCNMSKKDFVERFASELETDRQGDSEEHSNAASPTTLSPTGFETKAAASTS